MIPEIATSLLYVALVISIAVIGRFPVWSKSKSNHLVKLVFLKFMLVLTSLLMLIYCFVVSDFSVLNVFYNSHESKPLIYKISGAWGNHEGSMLMWLTFLNGFTFLFSIFSKGDKETINYTILVQCFLSAIFLAFVIFTSSPFERIFPAPENGLGLNPILQDIGLAFHPPMLYMGYVGFSLAFSSALASLMVGRLDKNWSLLVKPWVLISWIFLTIGIGLGSWWAYRELGWGGYWFWDPVENASLMPWLSATALIHSLAVTLKKEQFKISTLALAILTFSLSLVGTFIVRSGLVTSVHSFAHDPKRGIFIMIIISFLMLASITLYIVRAHKINYKTTQFHFFSRTIFIMINNLMLVVAASVVLVGTLYPLVLELITDVKISVGAPYFNSLIGPISIVGVIFCLLGSELNWVKDDLVMVIKKNSLPFLLAALVTGMIFIMCGGEFNLMYFLGVLASFWLIIHLTCQLLKFKPKIISGFYAMYFAHCGFAILVISVILNHGMLQEIEKPVSYNEVVKLGNFSFKFKGINYSKHQNYVAKEGVFEVYLPNNRQIFLIPETRLFPVEKQQTTEAAIFHHMFYDLYITIGELNNNEQIIMRASVRPMISWIWFSCILIAFGGINGLVVQIYHIMSGRDKPLHSQAISARNTNI